MLLVCPDIDPALFVLDLHMKYTGRWSLYERILHGLLSCDSSLICKKCCRVFAHHYTLDDAFILFNGNFVTLITFSYEEIDFEHSGNTVNRL